MGGPEIDAFQQHAQLLRIDLTPCLLARSWPGETMFLQTLLPQTESVAVPIHRFQDPSFAIAEQEQRRLEDVGLHHLLDEDDQPVDLFPHVRRPGADEHSRLFDLQPDHGRRSNTESTFPRWAASTPGHSRKRYRRSTMSSIAECRCSGGSSACPTSTSAEPLALGLFSVDAQ